MALVVDMCAVVQRDQDIFDTAYGAACNFFQA